MTSNNLCMINSAKFTYVSHLAFQFMNGQVRCIALWDTVCEFLYILTNVSWKHQELSLMVTAAYPAAYAPISQAFPQQPAIIPQQQREGEWDHTPFDIIHLTWLTDPERERETKTLENNLFCSSSVTPPKFLQSSNFLMKDENVEVFQKIPDGNRTRWTVWIHICMRLFCVKSHLCVSVSRCRTGGL